MTVEKPKPRQLLRPITTGTKSAMNQSQFLAITCNSLEARKKSSVHGAIGFGFASHWLKNWRDSFKPITTRINCNHVMTFDSHLKTALYSLFSQCLSHDAQDNGLTSRNRLSVVTLGSLRSYHGRCNENVTSIELCVSILRLFKDLLLRARVVVRTSKIKISRSCLADYVKRLRQKACGSCNTTFFPHSTNQIIDLWC